MSSPREAPARPTAFEDISTPRLLGYAATAVVLLAVGVAEGLFGVLAHGTAVGLTLALLAPAATAWAVPGGFTTRMAFTLGWVLSVLYFSRLRGEGDYLVASGGSGYVLLGFGVLLALLTGLTLRPLRPPAADPTPTESVPDPPRRSPRPPGPGT